MCRFGNRTSHSAIIHMQEPSKSPALRIPHASNNRCPLLKPLWLSMHTQLPAFAQGAVPSSAATRSWHCGVSQDTGASATISSVLTTSGSPPSVSDAAALRAST